MNDRTKKPLPRARVTSAWRRAIRTHIRATAMSSRDTPRGLSSTTTSVLPQWAWAWRIPARTASVRGGIPGIGLAMIRARNFDVPGGWSGLPSLPSTSGPPRSPAQENGGASSGSGMGPGMRGGGGGRTGPWNDPDARSGFPRTGRGWGRAAAVEVGSGPWTAPEGMSMSGSMLGPSMASRDASRASSSAVSSRGPGCCRGGFGGL